MKRVSQVLASLFLLASCCCAVAQSDPQPVSGATSRSIDAWVTNTEEHVIALAEDSRWRSTPSPIALTTTASLWNTCE